MSDDEIYRRHQKARGIRTAGDTETVILYAKATLEANGEYPAPDLMLELSYVFLTRRQRLGLILQLVVSMFR
jgi:hypothetical protein